jgi:hypothetical protein
MLSFLFFGTSQENICRHAYDMRLHGSSHGNLAVAKFRSGWTGM